MIKGRGSHGGPEQRIKGSISMARSRTVNSIVNMSYNFGVKLASLLSSFVLRTVFIRVLGMQYAGVSGLFTDILTVLSFAELGIESAITYALYKPIADKDEQQIRKLMHFYKSAYRFVAASVLIVGGLCIPFLPMIIKDVPDIAENITLIYILYLLNTASSYLLIYKSTLLTASQKGYEISKITIWMSVLKCILQSVLLFVFHNFILYLVVGIILVLVQNILIGRKAEKEFPTAFDDYGERLEKGEIRHLFKDIKALFLYKLLAVVLEGTDSIIISAFSGTGLVGILANYNLIVKNVYKLILQIFSSAAASIGNLAVLESKERQYNVFKALFFMAFWFYGFCAVELYLGLTPFMIIWMGKENTFSMAITIVLLVDFFLNGIMGPVSSFRTSNGLFVQGQYRPLLMAIINVIVSVALVGKLGVFGVLLGTVISRLTTQIWFDPYLIYKHVFGKSLIQFFKKLLVYAGITLISCILCQEIQNLLHFSNLYVQLIVMLVCGAVVFNGICIILFRKMDEFVYLKETGMNLLQTIKGKVKK